MIKFGTGGWRAVIGDGFTKENVQILASAMAAKMKDENVADKGIVLDALSSCDDFAVHYQTYGNNPWGQGAALAALSVIR